MSQSNHLTSFSDQEIAEHCREESAKRAPNPRPSYCFELFRRAIDNSSQAAWDAIHRQYQALIRDWIGSDNVNREDLLQESYLKFFKAFQSKYTLAQFPNINTIIGAWRVITKNIVIDFQRVKKPAIQGLDEMIESFQTPQTDADPSLNTQHFDQQRLIRYIQDQLKDEEERIVFEQRFEFDLKPAAIAKKYPHLFASAKAVSTVVERIKLRLKRDPIISQLLDGLEF